MTASEFLIVLVSASVALVVGMSFAWLAWWQTKNAGWVDVIWTTTLGLTGAIGSFLMPGAVWRHALIAVLLLIWVLRLGSHIAGRNQKRHDDPRYAKLLQDWGKNASLQMYFLMLKQALVSIPLALALLLAAGVPDQGFRFNDALGLLVVIIAILGETLADRQLRQYIATHPAGGVCDAGLWSWSRHPNYFFQWLSWCGYAFIALDFSAAYLWGWLALAAPACMYWLLVFVSGIAPLEEHMLATRRSAFERYQQRTSAFFPWPPKAQA
jgi:steroid 5-alpha reductase family enzyme